MKFIDQIIQHKALGLDVTGYVSVKNDVLEEEI